MDIEIITSRDNRRLIEARKVRDGRTDGWIFLEGSRLVEEALRSKAELVECFAAEKFEDDLLVEIASQCKVRRVADELFASMADTDKSQGIVVIARRPVWELADINAASTEVPLVLFMKEINNPSNLGAIFRTAEAAGIAGIIISPNSTDPYSPKALRGSMGAALRLPIVTGLSLDAAIGWARASCMITTAAVPTGAVSYIDLDWTTPRLLVFGSEAHGLSEQEIAALDEAVIIPLANGVESLNLGVAAGILLFEARRPRDSG